MPNPYLHQLADDLLTYNWETSTELARRCGIRAEEASASMAAAYVRGTAWRREVPRDRRGPGSAAWAYRKAGPIRSGDTAWS